MHAITLAAVPSKRWLEAIPASPRPVFAWASSLYVSAMAIALAVSWMGRLREPPASEVASEPPSHAAVMMVADDANAAPLADAGPEAGLRGVDGPGAGDPIPAAVVPVARDAEPTAVEDSPTLARATIRREPAPLPPLSPAEQRRAKDAARALSTSLDAGTVVRGRGVLATVVDPAGTMWSDAVEQCAELEVDGVRGWRLPTRAEVAGLRREVPTSVYWTGAEDRRDPDGAWVYDTQRRRAAAWLKQEPTAAVVCVQAAPR